MVTERAGRAERERLGSSRIEPDLDVERRDQQRRLERIRTVNQSPWSIGAAWYDQRDTYTRNASIDANGYARGPSFHPEEGSYAYPRHTRPNDQAIEASDASRYEKEAWPWLVYKNLSADPYFAYLEPHESRTRRLLRRIRASVAQLFGRRVDAELRSDARIRSDAADALWFRRDLDSSDIEVTARDGEVTLDGAVADRRSKKLAGDIAREVRGVRRVHNRLEVRREDGGEGGLAFVPAM